MVRECDTTEMPFFMGYTTGVQSSGRPHPQAPATSAAGCSFGPSPQSMSATAMILVSLLEFKYQRVAVWPPYRFVRNQTTAKRAAATKNQSVKEWRKQKRKGIFSKLVSYRSNLRFRPSTAAVLNVLSRATSSAGLLLTSHPSHFDNLASSRSI